MNDTLSLLNDIYCFEDAAIGIFENNARAICQYEMSGDYEILTEGMSDVCQSIAKSIRKLMDAIKDFFVNFFRMFTNATLSFEDFCKKYESELSNWSGSFKYTGYKFKVLKSKDPNMNCFQKLISTYNESVADFGKIKIEDLRNESNKFLSDTNLNEIRAEVLGVTGAIDRDDFIKRIREEYRGSDTEEEFEISREYVKEIVSHAKDLVAMKKKAEKDRDAIINLLSKAEMFFNRKIGAVYKGENRYVDTKTFDYDTSYKATIKDADERETYSESAATKANTLITLKYNETKALATIINTVVTERANALKDEVKQENQIVRKALVRNKKDDTTTSTSSSTSSSTDDKVSESVDYFMVAEEFEYGSHQEVVESAIAAIVKECSWLEEAITTGDYTDAEVMEGIKTNAIDAIRNAIGFVLRKFREASIENMKKRSDWYTNEDVQAHIIESAKKHDLTIIPLWKGKFGSTQISNINKMVNALKKPTIADNDYQWAANFISITKPEDLTQDEIRSKIANFFLVGEKDKAGDPAEVRIAGAALSGQVRNMFKYLTSYDTYVNPTSQIESNIKAIKVAQEAFDIDSFSEILGRYVVESEIGILLEQTPTGTGNQNSGVASAQSAVASEKKDGATVTKPVENANSKLANNATKDTASTAEKKQSKNFKETCFRFAQIVINAYITALEKRFALYYNTINQCADNDYKFSAWMDKNSGNNQKSNKSSDTTPTENKKK